MAGRPREQAHELARIIREVLEEAAAAGGSLGYFQHRFKDYDLEGETCVTPGCGHLVKRLEQSGRSTFYCESCQPQRLR